jgi:hypothetical protein
MDPQHGYCAVSHDLPPETSRVLLDLGFKTFGFVLVGVEGDERPFGDELAVGTV